MLRIPNHEAFLSGKVDVRRCQIRFWAKNVFIGKPKSEVSADPIIAGEDKGCIFSRAFQIGCEFSEGCVQYITMWPVFFFDSQPHVDLAAPLRQKQAPRCKHYND